MVTTAKKKSASVLTSEELALLQDGSPEESEKLILSKCAVSGSDINTAIRRAKTSTVECFVAKVTPELARYIRTNNDISNRPYKQANIERLMDIIDAGRFKRNGDPIVVYKGLIIDGGHRLQAIAEGTTAVDLLFVINPPIDDIRHAILTTTSGYAKTANDRFGKLYEAPTQPALSISRHHFNLIYNRELAANVGADLISQHYLKNRDAINEVNDFIFTECRNTLEGVRTHAYSEEAIAFGGASRQSRLEMLAAVHLFLLNIINSKSHVTSLAELRCPFVLSELNKYTLAWISKSSYPAEHVTEVVRRYLIAAMAPPSDKKDARSVVRDERRPSMIMRYLIEGFVWHLQREQIQNHRLEKFKSPKGPTSNHYEISPEAEGGWYGVFYDNRKKLGTGWNVHFSVGRFDDMTEWLVKQFKEIKVI